jgi:hypothetical protein
MKRGGPEFATLKNRLSHYLPIASVGNHLASMSAKEVIFRILSISIFIFNTGKLFKIPGLYALAF